MEKETPAKTDIHNYFPNFDNQTFADALIMLTAAGVSGYVPLKTVARALWFVHGANLHPDNTGFKYKELGSYEFNISENGS